MTDPTPLTAEGLCQRCNGPNVLSWHAPSPLWNAVMRDPATGIDAFEIVCPPCFAELAEGKGFGGSPRWTWHFGPHEDVSALWADRDGRVWDSALCLWGDAARAAVPDSEGLRAALVHAARDVDGAWGSESEDDGAPILWYAEAGEVLADLRTAIEQYDAALAATPREAEGLRKALDDAVGRSVAEGIVVKVPVRSWNALILAVDAATPREAEGLNVWRLAEAMHASYERDPAVKRIEWSDLTEPERRMWINHARTVAAEYAARTFAAEHARLTEPDA